MFKTAIVKWKEMLLRVPYDTALPYCGIRIPMMLRAELCETYDEKPNIYEPKNGPPATPEIMRILDTPPELSQLTPFLQADRNDEIRRGRARVGPYQYR